jgi:glucokinase
MSSVQQEFAIGVDIGGTNMSAALIRRTDNQIITRETIETLAPRGPEDGMARLCAMIERVITSASVSRDAILGIGIGCTGPVDTQKGTVHNPYTLPTWDDLPIVAALTEAFHKPAILLNDAHVAALAEYSAGSGRGTNNMCYITVSTGIGGGLILNGRLYRGQGLMAGEVGHQSLNFEGRPCYCGASGCWEMYAAGPAIAKTAQERVTPDSQLWTLSQGQSDLITARLVGEAALAGDALALDIMRETAFYLAVGITNLINVLAPDQFVLGGGVMQSHALLLPIVRDILSKQTFMINNYEVRIAHAELGLNAGVVGAAQGIIRFLEGTL